MIRGNDWTQASRLQDCEAISNFDDYAKLNIPYTFVNAVAFIASGTLAFQSL